ncbi:MAG: DUF1848 domain-containing protein [Erysipelotrichaceae bacterium]|nr:DUF1848 domain-containing protein [Erysipelotrichaceae bacterium]
MIINTGSRTDIPAFYSAWLINRVHAGFLMARNPYYPKLVSRYVLDPRSVDALVFCTKNPQPILKDIHELDAFRQFWYVTITPYGKDIEPGVPDKHRVIESFITLSKHIGHKRMVWRYDPVFVNQKYDIAYHIRAFETIASLLEGYTERAVFSFIDLYEKTKRNFPEVREVSYDDQVTLTKAFVQSCEKHHMILTGCLESKELARYGADMNGCMTKQIIEQAIGEELSVPKGTPARDGCNCLLGNDIGAYNTCAHFCKYCYANYDREIVIRNMKKHDPESPLLIGHIEADDTVKDVNQKSWINAQLKLDL